MENLIETSITKDDKITETFSKGKFITIKVKTKKAISLDDKIQIERDYNGEFCAYTIQPYGINIILKVKTEEEKAKDLMLQQQNKKEEKIPILEEQKPKIRIIPKENFDHKDFTLRIREELEFLGLEHKEFAKSMYMSIDRIKRLLGNRAKYTPEEVLVISKKLGF